MMQFGRQSRRRFLENATKLFAAGGLGLKGAGEAGWRYPSEGKQESRRLVLGRDAGKAAPGQDDTDYFFAGIVSAATDPDGNIFVCDGRLSEVKKFAPDGRFIQNIGREGEGPGEYSRPTFIKSDGKDNLYVHDPLRRKFIQTDFAGEHKATLALPDLHPLLDFQPFDDEKLLLHIMPYEAPDEPKIFTIIDMKKRGAVVEKFGALPANSDAFGDVLDFAFEAIAEGVTYQDFYQGLFDFDPRTGEIYYLKRFHPKELFGYRVGVEEPRVISVDDELASGFTKRTAGNRVVVSGNQRTDNAVSLVDGTLYARIADTRKGTAVLKGYSTADGRISYRKELPSDFFRLMNVDRNLNAYLADFENQYLIRERL